MQELVDTPTPVERLIQLTTLSVLFALHLVAQDPGSANQRRAAAKQRELDEISTIVKGRCVDGETGAPLAGVRVELHAWGRNIAELPEQLKKPAPVTTREDGLFEVRCLARSRCQVSFDAEIEGRWPRTGRWRHLLPGTVEDLGDVRLHPGVYAEGRVVDTAGKPLVDTMVGIDELRLYVGCEDDEGDTRTIQERLRANAQSGERQLHLHANKVRWCRTDAEGRFRSRVALPPGTWQLRMNGNRFALQSAKTITIPERGPMEPITMTVEEALSLSGIVVEKTTGKPVRGAMIEALRGSGRMATGISKADGTFEIYRAPNSADTARVAIQSAPGFERPDPTKEYEWGTKDIRIELQRAPSVEVLVVDKTTGEPVEEFAVRAYPTTGRMSSADRRLRSPGRHEGGRLVVTGVRRGPGRIEIVPKDPRLLFATVDVVGAEGMKPLRIEVERLVPMMVQVLDAGGAPQARTVVQVISLGNHRPIGDQRPVNNPRTDHLDAFSSDPTRTFDTEIHRATTDEGGQCIVYGISGREDLVLGVRLDTRRMHRESGIAFGPKGNGHTIQLPEQ